MDYNLTQEYLTLLSWIGAQIRVGKLSPVFRIRFSSNPFIKGPHIDGQIVKTDYKGNYHPSMHPTITRASLVTLEDEQLLYYTISQKTSPNSTNKTIIYKCRFLEKATEIIGPDDKPAPPLPAPLTQEKSTLVRLDQGFLRQLLSRHFSLDELNTLCFDLGLEWENVPGQHTLDAKSRELIRYIIRKGLILKLIVMVVERRPEVDWSNILITG